MLSIGEAVQAKLRERGQKTPAVLERPQTDVAALLETGGVAVVVGGRPSNFPESMRRHPRFVFFDSTDPKAMHGKSLPSNARVVMMIPRFLGHHDTDRYKREAKRRGIQCLMLTTTGDIKDNLERVLDHEATRKQVTAPPVIVVPPAVVDPPKVYERIEDVSPATLAVPKVTVQEVEEGLGAVADPEPSEDSEMPRRHWMRGEQMSFVERYSNPDGSIRGEGRRLLALARSKGIESTEGSFEQAVRVHRRKLEEGTSAPPPERPVYQPVVFMPPTPVVKATPRPQLGEAKSTTDNLLQTIDDALQFVDEQKKMADEIKARAALMEEVFQKARREIERFRKAQERARQAFLLDEV